MKKAAHAAILIPRYIMARSSNTGLTEGPPLRLLISFILPMLIGNIVQQLYSMADSVIIGRFVGKGPFAALGATAPVLSVMIVVIIGFTMGIAITTARQVGAKNEEKVRDILGTTLLLCLILSAVFASVAGFFAEPILRLLKTPDDIIGDARTYLVFNFATCIGPIAYNMFSNILRSYGDSRMPLYALILSSALNIVLDLLFVIVFRWSVAGVAVATGISQIVSAVFCLAVIFRRYPQYSCRRKNVRLHGAIVLDILRFGMPMAASNLFASVGGVFVQRLINGYGTTVVAGYTAANRLDQLALSGMNSLGNAVSTYAGQNIGAGRPERVKEGIRASWLIGLGIALVFGLALFFFGGVLVQMFVSASETETIAVASGFFRMVSPFYLVGCGMYIYLGAMRGMGEIAVPMGGSFAELAAKLIAVFLLSRIGYHAMWAAWPIGWASALALLFLYYRFFFWRRMERADEGRRA